MNGPTHQLIGVTIAAGTGVAIGLPWQTLTIVAGGSYLASKTPDKAERFAAPTLGAIILTVGIGAGHTIIGVIAGMIIATWRLPHRGPLTHGIFVAVPITIAAGTTAALIIPSPLAVAAILGLTIGYLAHLAADACTVSGLTAWPLRHDGRVRHIWLLPRPLRHNMTPRRVRARRPRRIPPRAPR